MKCVENTREAELLSRDGLHQNDLGYRCMAEHIARAVVVSAFSFQKLSSTGQGTIQQSDRILDRAN